MVSKGNLYLKNSALVSLYENTKTYESIVQDALYSQYKISFKISKSNYFRGNAADTFKNYISNGTINILSELMDIASEMSMIAQLFAETFYKYETNRYGQVEEGALDYIDKTLNAKENTFESAKSELNDVLKLATQYITTANLSWDSVNSGYTKTKESIQKIRQDLYNADDELLNAANELLVRIQDIRTFIQKTWALCYNIDGTINVENLDKINAQDWYKKAGNVTLALLLNQDPFKYSAGETTLAEDQWAAGLCSDVYAYAGYKFLTASGEAGVENGTAFAKGSCAVLEANAYAQLTDYVRAQANAKLFHANGEARASLTETSCGVFASGEVVAASVDGSIIIGTDVVNAYIKGEAKALSAEGKIACEFDYKTGEYSYGVDVEATAASAKANAGLSFLSFRDEELATATKERLLGFAVGAEATAGGSFAIWSDSKTAFELEHCYINATTYKVDLGAGVGFDILVTVPTLYFKWGW